MRLAVLVLVSDARGRILLLRRRKRPNRGRWSPLGGKIEVARGESPHEAARREVREEAGISLGPRDLHLAGILTERRWEGREDWLVFAFRARSPRGAKARTSCPEGALAWMTRSDVRSLPDAPQGMRYFWRRMRAGARGRPFVLTIEGRSRGAPRILAEE